MSLLIRDAQGNMAPLTPGAYLVSRQKLSGPMTHYGVLVTRLGGAADEIIDLQESGVRIASVLDFAAGHEISIHRGAPPDAAHEVIARARTMLQTRPGYDALGFNCEHMATYVLDGKAESGQVALGAIVGVLVLAALLARD